MPYVITDQVRATGADNEQFTHQVGFHGSSGMEYVETTDRILLDGGGWTQFARSKEPGEIWPAVYEKAYAKWRLGETSDFPAIPSIAGGDPSIACKALTGLLRLPQLAQLVHRGGHPSTREEPLREWTHDDADGRLDLQLGRGCRRRLHGRERGGMPCLLGARLAPPERVHRSVQADGLHPALCADRLDDPCRPRPAGTVAISAGYWAPSRIRRSASTRRS